MSKETNGIATWSDLGNRFSYSSASKCPTKSEIQAGIKSGYKVTISGTYSSNQCVKYSSVKVKSNVVGGTIKIVARRSFQDTTKLHINFQWVNQTGLIKGETEAPFTVTVSLGAFSGTRTVEVPSGITASLGYDDPKAALAPSAGDGPFTITNLSRTKLSIGGVEYTLTYDNGSSLPLFPEK